MTTLKDKRLLWDFDSPVYAAIAIAQKNANDEGLEEVPTSYACQALKAAKEGLIKHAGNDNVSLYIQGENNFRKNIASILPYKGNRPPKPAGYNEVRGYAVRKLGAILVDGMEAEDKVAIEYNLNPSNSIMISQDKDMLQVPGYHYNYKTGEFKTISKLEGNRRFWSQVLTGDCATDNILGIPKTGAAKASVIVKNVNSMRQGWEVCKEAYKQAFFHKRCFQKETPKGLRWDYERGSGLVCHDGTVIGWREALIETCHLIWLLRYEGEQFEPID